MGIARDLTYMRRSLYKSLFLNILVWPLIGGFSIALFFCPDCIANDNLGELIESGLISALFWAVFANGNDTLVVFMNKHWSWVEQLITRLIIAVFVMSGFTVLASFIIHYCFVTFYFDAEFSSY